MRNPCAAERANAKFGLCPAPAGEAMERMLRGSRAEESMNADSARTDDAASDSGVALMALARRLAEALETRRAVREELA